VTSHRASGGSRRLSPVAVLNVLLASLVVMCVGVAGLARGVPLTGRLTFVVSGPSMAPTLAVGSAIIVEPVDPATLAVGDIVSVRNGPTRAVFTHRITRIVRRDGSTWLETKGDANGSPDPSLVPAADVLGRVSVAIPVAGYLLAVGSHPSGIVLVAAVGLLLLVAAWLLDPKRSASAVEQPA
jgi:signal peptidase